MKLTVSRTGATKVAVTDDTHRIVLRPTAHALTVGAGAVPGSQGPVGPGVPAGGATNAVLAKLSASDFDTAWVAPALRVALISAVATRTNQQTGTVPVYNNWGHVARVDLTTHSQVRFTVNKEGTAAATGSKLILRYYTSYSRNAANYSDIGSSEVSVVIDGTNTMLQTGWINLAAGAKGDVYVGIIGTGGDGAADPVFGAMTAEFR